MVDKSGNNEVIELLDPLSVLKTCDWLFSKVVVVVIKETVLDEEDASFIAELMVH